MRRLVLGGTSFIGRAIVEDALRSGFAVTLFNRGRTGATLFPGVPRLLGDRETSDYRSLGTSRWDAVVDVSGYVPRHVNAAMDALGDRIGRYLFLSSNAVYGRTGHGPGSAEDTPRLPPRRDTEWLDQDSYGPLKVACEDDIVGRLGARATIVRPGKVGGPHDDSDMLTYWVRRAARGGRVALPGDPEQPAQITDSRDLARLVLRLLLDGRPGAFHAVGPDEPVTLGKLIETCAEVAGTKVTIVPVPAESAPPFFPLVREPGSWAGLRRSNARARAAGMPATPLAMTIADVAEWDRGRGEPPLRTGFSAQREAELLAAVGDEGQEVPASQELLPSRDNLKTPRGRPSSRHGW